MNPELDIRQLVIDLGVATAGEVVVGQRTEVIDNDYQIVVRSISGTANPKWLFDDFTFSFLVIGSDRSKQAIVDQKIWQLHDALLGLGRQVYGNNSYQQFNIETTPNFIGLSQDNAKPQYIMTMTINRQIQVATGNRLPL